MSHALASSSVQALDVGGAFDDAFRSVITFLPKLAAFLVILLIGWLVARLLRALVSKLLQKVRFDRAVQRAGLSEMGARVDAGDLIARIVYYGVLLMALQLAFGVFGPNPVSDLLNRIVAWLPLAAVAIIIVVVAAALANAVRDVITRALGGVSYGPFIGRLASWFIIALGVIAALNQIGVATTVTMPILIAVLAAAAGILIVGVGGGLIRPMQQRWESWLGRAEREIPVAKAQAEAYQRGREDAAREHTTRTPVTTPHTSAGGLTSSGSRWRGAQPGAGAPPPSSRANAQTPSNRTAIQSAPVTGTRNVHPSARA